MARAKRHRDTDGLLALIWVDRSGTIRLREFQTLAELEKAQAAVLVAADGGDLPDIDLGQLIKVVEEHLARKAGEN